MLNLREHQAYALAELEKGFNAGHTRQFLYAPTGAGKTECAIAIMQEYSRKYQRCAMVMDRIVLVEQTSLRLGKYQIDHGVMQAGHWRYRPSDRIQICSIQTLARRGKMNTPDILLYDEAHVLHKSMLDYIKDNPQMRVIGLSATPFTKGLKALYTNVVTATSTEALIGKGFLCPLKVFIAKEIDMTGAKKIAGEWSSEEVASRGMKITGDIVSEWVKKTYEIFGQARKTIVFCSGVEHGRDLERQFNAAGYNFVSISYKEDDEFKRMTIEQFSKPDSPIIGLIATDILTKGFDVSDVMIGVSARPFSKSLSSHVQQMGRVLRSHEGKEFAVWLDHSGNYLRFRDDWDNVYSNGVQELREGGEAAKKEPSEREKKEAKCPKCEVLWTFKSDTCGSCGFVKIRMSTVETIPGELKELEAANKKLRIDNQSFYSQLLFYAQAKGYKSGWAFHKYKEKFNAAPNGLASRPEHPTPQTLNWIKSRTIAFAKSKARAA
jgi:superfamily II DNA or RNA helicase